MSIMSLRGAASGTHQRRGLLGLRLFLLIHLPTRLLSFQEKNSGRYRGNQNALEDDGTMGIVRRVRIRPST